MARLPLLPPPLLVNASWLLLLLLLAGISSHTKALLTTTTASCAALGLDVDRLVSAISQGRVYQQFNFFTSSEIDAVREEMRQLQEAGAFAPSGLSNTAAVQQGFGQNDRTVCAVPWWRSMLEESSEVPVIASKLQDLRLALATTLSRPAMRDATLAHECYYSMGGIGSSLPRHLDEKHEELKGSKGWLLPSRRSLSWLVYLSDEGWTAEHGGALRYYHQPNPQGPLTHHTGNLQVGWLRQPSESRAVYLDSWYPNKADPSQPLCILYAVEQGQPRLLTKPWLTSALSGMSVADFISQAGDDLFLSRTDAEQFALIEDRPAWEAGYEPAGSVAEDVLPVRGSLVIFDSVVVPHQVQQVLKGTRIALAGWFHEETQPFPEYLMEA